MRAQTLSRQRGRLIIVGPIAVILLVFAATAFFTLRSVGRATHIAESQNVASRQTALLNRFEAEVFLALSGVEEADPDTWAEALRANADALVEGGEVSGFQGSGHAITTITPVTHSDLRRKFEQSRVLLDDAVFAGEEVVAASAIPSAVDAALLGSFRVKIAALSSNMKDAAGSLTARSVSDANREVRIHLLLGVSGLAAALALSIVQWRVATSVGDRRYRALVDRANDLVVITDREGVITFVGDSARHILGVDPDGLLGTSILSWSNDADAEALAAVLTTTAPHQASSIEHSFIGTDGREIVLDTKVSNLLSMPEIAGFVVNSHDITTRQQLETELTRQAFEDSLTGLPNRALLVDRVNHSLRIAARSSDAVALLFVDLDEFKLINDSHGHAIGDEVLVAAANRLSGCLRAGDTIARLGGDEFAILMENLRSVDEALVVGQRVVDALREPFTVAAGTVATTASVGLVFNDQDTHTALDMLRDADLAMYRAKAEGRNRFVVFQDEMYEVAIEDQLMATALREAIGTEEFYLAFQPIVASSDGSIVAAEALARWNSPTFGHVSPVRFIELAERSGLINDLGEWVLRTACATAASWTDGPMGPLSINVNVSGHQLRDGDFDSVMRDILDETGLPAERLTIELTESFFVELPAVVPAIQSIRDMGVRVAIDDFGTGYSTLSLLADLPVDIVKIDKAFIDRLDQPEGSMMLRGILQLINGLALTSTAEGVEEEAQHAFLDVVGCDTIQGYFFSRPVSPSDLSEMLATPICAA